MSRHRKLIDLLRTTSGWLFSHLRRTGPMLAVLAGIGLAACSDSGSDTGKEIDRVVQAVLSSPELKERLARVLNTPAPAAPAGQDIKTPPTTRSGTEPFAACPQFFAAGQSPILQPQPWHRPLCFDSFAVLHSGWTKTPVFVAQKLNRQSVADASNQKRTDRFFADGRLPISERAELEDYRRSGYSRGHMAPAGDMPNPTAMAQSFSLANMVPQSERHNGSIWAKVEQDTRKFAQRAKGNVYVVTGPVCNQGSKTIGDSRVCVPDHIFKLVYDEAGQRAWAHWHANQDDARGSAPISYRELVQRTGIDFLPGADL